MVRTIKLQIWKLCAPVQPSGHQPSGSGRSKPYYGNYIKPKCNRPDARATPSGRGLVMEAFSATLERRLQLTVRTPSGILVINFYSNIGLGRNRRCWKAKKKLCNLRVGRPLIESGWPCRKSHNYFPDKNNFARPDGPGSRQDARAPESIFDSILGFQSL
jgi:hypothetical protein